MPYWEFDHGVSFFFVLSGFILTYAYPELGTWSRVGRFLAARIARIWPAHLVALLFAMAAIGLPLDRTLPANVLLVHGWIPSWPWYFGYNAPSWSVSTELFFYLAFPALIFDWSRSWWWKWALAALLVLVLIWLGPRLGFSDVSSADQPTLHGLLYISPLARLFEFVTGMVSCLAFRALLPIGRRLNGTLFTVLEAIVLAGAAYGIVSPWMARLLAGLASPAGNQWLAHTSDVAVFPLVILVFAFGRGLLSRLLASRPLIVLGEMSYSIYLLHVTVFALVRMYHPMPVETPDYLGLAIGVAIISLLAAIVWRHVEIPCRSAVKRWAGLPAAVASGAA